MKKFIFKSVIILLLLIVFVMCSADNKISFVGADGCAQTHFKIIDKLAMESDITFYGIESFRWYIVEPLPPVEGIHNYTFSILDSLISKIENAGGRALVELVCVSTWATKQTMKSRVASPPKEENWEDYADFISAIVERYDNDGINDMPELKYAHLYYKIEDEAENYSSWNGSVEEYIKLLKTAKIAAQKSNPDVKILTFSPNFADLFAYKNRNEVDEIVDNIESVIERKKEKRKILFTKSVLIEEDAYDIIAVQYNYHYSSLYGNMKLLRKYSDKPIWIADASSSILLGRQYKADSEYSKDDYPYLEERDIAAVLSDVNEQRHKEIISWWEAERARTTFKKIIEACSLGAGKIFIQFLMDIEEKADAEYNPWIFTGLTGKNGELRPVCYSIRLFHEKLSGFSNIIDFSERTGPCEEWVMHYRFTVKKKKIDVLWTDGEKKTVKFSKEKQNIIITPIIENINEKQPLLTKAETDRIEIGRSPLMIEKE